MIELQTHNFLGLSRKEIWFYRGEPVKRAAYTVFSAAYEIPPGPTRFLEDYSTSIIDLSKDESELFQAIHPTYRYDIRSAEKQKVSVKQLDSPTREDCKRLAADFDKFAKAKNLSALNHRLLCALQAKDHLCITAASVNGITVTTHVYVCNRTQVSLLSSFNNVRYENDKTRSEANKFLHWQDLLFFKKRGMLTYDFGGLNPEKLPGITKFKTSFGGTTVTNYRLIQTPAVLFHLISVLKKLKK